MKYPNHRWNEKGKYNGVMNGNIIYVKREDLYSNFPAPNLAKLRGIKKFVEKLEAKGIKTIGCWNWTSISRTVIS